MSKRAYLYILSNQNNAVLAMGSCVNLKAFLADSQKKVKGMKLVYYEKFYDLEEAQTRVGDLKRQARQDKLALIDSLNPDWKDLWEEV